MARSGGRQHFGGLDVTRDVREPSRLYHAAVGRGPIQLLTERLVVGSLAEGDEPTAFEEVFNSNPDFIEALEGFTGKRHYDVDEIGLHLWAGERPRQLGVRDHPPVRDR